MRTCVLFAIVFVSACAQVHGDLAAPPPAPALPGEYRIQVGDVLGVRLYLASELNEDVTVQPDGRMTTTLAQSVPAAGRTPEEVAASLRPAYAMELKAPVLTVQVRTAAPVRVYVAGEVVAPGEFFETGPNLTLVQAVARAGGLRTTGDPAHVFILRREGGDHATVYGTQYQAAVTGADPRADVRLAPYDVVYVPRTGIGQAYIWFNQHFQQFVPVSWGFSYNVDPFVTNTKK